MELQLISIKFFAEDSTSVGIREFIPIFHSWIPKKTITDHLLIDVVDYSHVYQGPGIVLVTHEANYSIDPVDNRLGLPYQRKRPIRGSFEQRPQSLIRVTLQACRNLEDDPKLKGKLKFKGNEFLLISNDRLLAPNKDESFEAISRALVDIIPELYGGDKFTLTRDADRKERLTICVKTSNHSEVNSLLNAQPE